MGLFDNLFGQNSGAKIGKSEAFAGILLGAIASDGSINDAEAQGLWAAISRMKLYENYSENKFSAMMDQLIKVLRREGVDKLVDRCVDALPDDLRDCAFANACDLVLADGVVEDEEKEFIDRLQKCLELDGDTALTIVEVMITKNKG